MIKKVFFLGAPIGSFVLICAFVYQATNIAEIVTRQRFTETKVPVESNNLVDLGVVDFNKDGAFDIYTSNHHSRQSLLKGDGRGGFEDVLSSVGLDQHLQYPGLEIAGHPPKIVGQGFYIYWQNSGLVLRSESIGEAGAVSGQMQLLASTKVVMQKGFEIEIRESREATGLTKSTIDFVANSVGEVQISTNVIAIPIVVNMSEAIPLESIFIGQNLINPPSHRFELFLNDRHGMAWADYNGDGHLDVFIARGGLRNTLSLFSEEFRDELFEMKPPKFFNNIRSTDITKGFCPGYNTHWVDYNKDNFLDLYISCHHENDNIFFRNHGDGTFSNVAAALGLDFANELTDTPFAWIDADGDGDLDLFIADDDGLRLYANEIDRFELDRTFPLSGIATMTMSDYDTDGDIDLFVSSYSGMSSLLVNENFGFSRIAAEQIGLPGGSLTANWVDYDNDGFVDIHTVPGGLYRQEVDHSFRQTGLLKHRLPFSVRRARASWCDIDNDGDVDLLLAINYESPFWKVVVNKLLGQWTPSWAALQERNFNWVVRAFLNELDKQAGDHNWLQMKLVGDAGNIEAIGAKVTLERGGKTVAAQVGQAEGSLMSQGHYRLYFGLGDHSDAMSMHVLWPDGSEQERKVEAINSLVEVVKSRVDNQNE